MEQVTIKYGKVLENTYSDSPNNYVGNSELTVTITLNEYRELIASKATKEADIDKLRRVGYEKDAQISELKSQNERLISMVAENKNEV